MRQLREFTQSPMQFLLWLRKSKLNKAGTAPIMLRVFLSTHDRAEYSTRIRCRPDEWNAAKGQLRGSDEAARTTNALLKKLESRARLLADRLQDAVDADPDLPTVAPAAVVAALAPKPRPVQPTLLETLRAALLTYPALPSALAATGYAVAAFAKWPGSQQLRPSECTPSQAQAYAAWLAPRYAAGTRRLYLERLNTLLRYACPEQAPTFLRLVKGGNASASRRALTPEWLEKLRLAPLTPSQALARTVFFLQFYLHGSRISAVLTLRREQVDWAGGRLRFTAMKVENQKDVALRPELLALLAPYRNGTGPLLLPVLPHDYFSLAPDAQHQALQRGRGDVKNALARAGRAIGWQGSLHPHLARHSLALRAYQVSGDLRLPQQMLGHSSVAITARYIASLNTSELDSGAATVYDSLL